MFDIKSVLLYAVLLVTLLEPTSGRRGRGFSHSKWGGLFGGGRKHPPSGGLFGGGRKHPPSGGLFGGGRKHPPSGYHGYQSSGGSHSYPLSGGLSGDSHRLPQMVSRSHSYPLSGGLSGDSHRLPQMVSKSHSYPLSGGLSGDSHRPPQMVSKSHSYPLSGGLSGYSVRPSQRVFYPPAHHVTPVQPVHYPVYQGQPLPYVNTLKNSGSKYGPLLAGLALLNLGTLGAAAYAASGHGKTHYTPQKGEVCKFAIRKENGDYDEMNIDCQIMSSFILKDQALLKASNTSMNVTNWKVIPRANGDKLVPNMNTTIRTTTLPNAERASTNCYVIHISPSHKMERNVPCDLLMTYAKQSDSEKLNARNGHARIVFDLDANTFLLNFLVFFSQRTLMKI